MTREQHIRLIEGVRADKKLSHFIYMADKVSVVAIVAAYAVLLIRLMFFEHFGIYLLPGCLVVPLVSFVIFSLVRKVLNRPRPYKVYGIEPIMPRDKDGESFPSRHVFSAFLISVTYVNVSFEWAAMIGVVGIVLAVLRVCEGTHFVKDVVVGAIVGLLCGLIGFCLYYEFYYIPLITKEIKTLFNNGNFFDLMMFFE